jgi:hypothetical protein
LPDLRPEAPAAARSAWPASDGLHADREVALMNDWIVALNACLNVVQALGIAWLAARYRIPERK